MSGWRGVLALLLLAWGEAMAGSVSGRFTLEGDQAGVIEPTQVAALEVRDSSDPRRRLVEIVLSGAPIDVGAALVSLHPHEHIINQPALDAHDYILMWLQPDGRMGVNATFREGMRQYISQSGGNLRLDLEVNTPQRVAGRLYSQVPEATLSGSRYAFDVRFDTAIVRPARGEALKAGGGAPGKALQALLSAVHRLQWPAIRAACTSEAQARFGSEYASARENAQATREILKVWLPAKGLKITGGELRGDTADLEITGEMYPGTQALYLARMRKVGAVWLFDTAGMAGLLPHR